MSDKQVKKNLSGQMDIDHFSAKKLSALLQQSRQETAAEILGLFSDEEIKRKWVEQNFYSFFNDFISDIIRQRFNLGPTRLS